MLHRKRILAGAIALAFFGVVAASAASLGGLTANNLGADNTVVASCDTDGVGLTYTTAYNAGTGAYEVTAATVTGVAAACGGQTLSLTLSGAGGVSLGSGSVAVPAGGGSVAVPIAPNADAESVLGAAVVITG